MSRTPKYLTTAEVAKRKGVHTSTVTRWVQQGRLTPANKPGGWDGKKSARYLFTPADVDNLT